MSGRYPGFVVTLSGDTPPEKLQAIMDACRSETPVEVAFEGGVKRKMRVIAVSIDETANVVARAPTKRRRSRKARKR